MHRHAPTLSPFTADVRREFCPRVHAWVHPRCTRNAPAPKLNRSRKLLLKREKSDYLIDLAVTDVRFVLGFFEAVPEKKKPNDLRCPTQILSRVTKIASGTLLDKYTGVIRRAAKRRQARQGERACTRAGRSLTLRPPGRCEPGSYPCHSSCAHHQQHAEQIDRLRARERATRGAEREFGADAHGDAGRSNRRQRRSNQRGAHACTARWWRCFSSRSFRSSTGYSAPASAPAALRHRMPPVFGKYLSPSRRHASAMGPRPQRRKIPGACRLVVFRGAYA